MKSGFEELKAIMLMQVAPVAREVGFVHYSFKVSFSFASSNNVEILTNCLSPYLI